MSTSTTDTSSSQRHWWLPAAALVPLLGFAFYCGHKTSSPLEWCYYFDTFRDIGIAQQIVDGRYPEDLLYLGEVSWYNPGVGALVAALSTVVDAPLHVIDVRAGAYLNLLAPVCLFLLVWAWFDSWTALIAVLFYILGNPWQKGTGDPSGSWACSLSTYTPWLWAPHFAQTFFYASMAAYWKALETRRIMWTLVAGILLGTTFLFHTAPALAFGMTVLLTVWTTLDWRQGVKKFVATGAAAFGGGLAIAVAAIVVSLPFTLPIFLRYQFDVANQDPSLYVSDYFNASTWRTFATDLLTASNGIALVGLAVLVLGRNKPQKWLLAAWGLCAFVFLFHSFLIQVVPKLPKQILPPHHFMISLSGFKCVVFAIGVVQMCRWSQQAAAKLPVGARVRDWAFPAALFVAVFGILLYYAPSYPKCDEFFRASNKDVYEDSWNLTRHPPVYRWMLEKTQPHDVFLINNLHLELKAAMATGRKVVACALSAFSNPYVPFDPRNESKALMWSALQRDDRAQFLKLAQMYHVTHVVLDRHSPPGINETPVLERVFETPHVTAYRVRGD